MGKVLISAFKPFNNEYMNITYEIIKKLDQSFGEKIILDVVYIEDSKKIIEAIDSLHPNLVICLGQAGGRSKICLEQFALNMRSASIKDNNNQLITHTKIINEGLSAHETNIDLVKMMKSMPQEYVTISYNAGTFVCNDIYYTTLNHIFDKCYDTKCLFVHIPYCEHQIKDNNTPYIEFNTSLKVVESIIKYLKNEYKL